jgi:hypothetical protein
MKISDEKICKSILPSPWSHSMQNASARSQAVKSANLKSVLTLATVVVTLAPSLGLLALPAQAQDLNDIRRRMEDFLRPNPSPNPGGNPGNNPGASNNPNRGNGGGTLTNSNGEITRAMHLARQAAERTNGGLNVYRAEPSMYTVERAPYVVNRDNTVTFTFLGGAPAQPPSLQSVITVTPDGSRVNVDYNGPIRPRNGN